MKLSDAVDFVWLSAAVLSGLSALGGVGIGVGPVFQGRLPALIVLPLLGLLWGATAYGVKHRRRWGWWLAVALFGVATAILVPLSLWCWFSTLKDGDRRGVGGGGPWIVNFLLPVGVVFGLGPLRTLLRAPDLFKSAE
ncbi:MAG: hypothetical protein JO332_01360 [Planctomycetaceae bacterium]|nr:hypothetical protein [Planctomycetaceae bacterium]